MSDERTRSLARAAADGGREEALAHAKALEREDGLATRLDAALRAMLSRANRRPPWGACSADALGVEQVLTAARSASQARSAPAMSRVTSCRRRPDPLLGHGEGTTLVAIVATTTPGGVEETAVGFFDSDEKEPRRTARAPADPTKLLPWPEFHVHSWDAEGPRPRIEEDWVANSPSVEAWASDEMPLVFREVSEEAVEGRYVVAHGVRDPAMRWEPPTLERRLHVFAFHRGKAFRLVTPGAVEDVEVYPVDYVPSSASQVPPPWDFVASVRRALGLLAFPDRVRATTEVVRRWILLREEGEIR